MATVTRKAAIVPPFPVYPPRACLRDSALFGKCGSATARAVGRPASDGAADARSTLMRSTSDGARADASAVDMDTPHDEREVPLEMNTTTVYFYKE